MCTGGWVSSVLGRQAESRKEQKLPGRAGENGWTGVEQGESLCQKRGSIICVAGEIPVLMQVGLHNRISKWE